MFIITDRHRYQSEPQTYKPFTSRKSCHSERLTLARGICSFLIGLLLLELLLSLSFLAFAQVPPPVTNPKAAAKPTDNSQLYRNSTFGFRYKIPFGWVDRTKEMREQSATQPADPPQAGESSSARADSKEKAGTLSGTQGELLLAVFERPPEASGDSVNSAVVIASESAAAYPGLKKAEDYLGPLTELTTAKGFKSDGDPSIADIDGRQLVRADFTRPLTDKIAMHQSTLVLLAKGRIVSFTFIAGSEEEVDELMDGLHFVVGR